MIRIFEKCPACGGQITITECRCGSCQLEMRGEFRTGQFSELSDDQLTFVRVFLRARGNLSEVEKVLGVSYPTIRNKLDEINTAIDSAALVSESEKTDQPTRAETVSTTTEESRRLILQQVASGELSATDAVEKLLNLGAK